jgi:integrase
MKLTNENVRTLPAKTGDTLYPDNDKHNGVPGLFLRVRKGGSRTFIIKWRQGAMQRRAVVGKVGVINLDEARKAARKLIVGIDEGNDPVALKAKARVDDQQLFEKLAQDYLNVREKDLKPGSFDQYQRHLRLYSKPFNRVSVSKIDRALIAAELRNIARDRGGVTANRTRSTLSDFFAWCIGEGYREENPVIGTNMAPTNGSRERVLTDDELVWVWQAADPTNDYGRIVRLLMLTAQRRDEIAALSRSEVKESQRGQRLIDLPAERTKNSRPHMIPLSEAACAILDGTLQVDGREFYFGIAERGFTGFSRAKAAMDARIAEGLPPGGVMPHWTLHDLRRTVATVMGDKLGVLPHITEAILNHISTAASGKAGVAGVYNRALYLTEKQQALEAWEGYLLALLARAEGANVVPLIRA